jgi:serine/threonine protein kinase
MTSEPDKSDTREEFTSAVEPASNSQRVTEPLLDDSAKSGERTATEVAPPFRPMMAEAKRPSASGLSGLPDPGQRFDDFELLQILGEGAFGRVYLAVQISLGRQVALKVIANRGQEAQTLAQLEHDHIIHVFAETVKDNWRLLCMQYVPGTNLDAILRALAKGVRKTTWDGHDFLSAIDELSTQPATLEPALLRDRELLSAGDFAEVVCWIGCRLAEALDHAHRQGILHRDIKPANILFNGYGRPMLADFSLACRSLSHLDGDSSQAFGGTLSYMAPEHLDAFLSRDRSARQAVDERSDLYSLGVVLFEFLTGCLPHSRASKEEMGLMKIASLAEERRSSAPSARQENPLVPEVLDRTIGRCLDPHPQRRYQKSGELARALEGCGQLRQAEKEMPAASPITRLAQRHPFLIVILLAVLPNLLGSIVNISYNSMQIVGALEAPQRQMFYQLLIGYNAIIYPICVGIACWLLVPVMRAWRELHGKKSKSEIRNLKKQQATEIAENTESQPSVLSVAPAFDQISDVAAMRRRALAFPTWTAGLSCLGWLPGAVLFPFFINLAAGPISSKVFLHFVFSFSISGLIALTYSGMAVQWVVLRVIYPRMWEDGSGFRETARQELTDIDRRLRAWQFLAGLIPLSGAALIIGVQPEEEFSVWLRILAIALIALGMAGLGLGLLVGSRVQQVLAALRGQ